MDHRQPEPAGEVGRLVETALQPPRGCSGTGTTASASERMAAPSRRIIAASGTASDRRPSYLNAWMIFAGRRRIRRPRGCGQPLRTVAGRQRRLVVLQARLYAAR